MAGSESRTLGILALITSMLIAIMKFVAVGLIGSAPMPAEGLSSTVDGGNRLFLLRGATVSRYGPSARVRFGRGNELQPGLSTDEVSARMTFVETESAR